MSSGSDQWHWLDVTAWAVTPPEEATVVIARDRAAARVMTAYWVASWAWAIGLCAVLVPSVAEIPTLDPIAIGVLGVLGPLVVVALLRWWRRIRRGTGYPVIAELVPAARHGAALLAYFAALLSPDDASELSVREQAVRLQRRRAAAREHRIRERRLLIAVETAALAERWGWGWLRRRNVRSAARVIMTMDQLFLQLNPEVADLRQQNAAAEDDEPEQQPSQEIGPGSGC